MASSTGPVSRLIRLVREERSYVSLIYFYAAIGGIIQLSLPLGIQAIIGFVLAGTLTTSLIVLISVLVLGVALNGYFQIAQMRVIETIQQRIFVRYAYAFADRIPRLDLRKVDALYLPELVNRFFDTGALQKNMAKLLIDVPTAMIQILFGLILLSFYHPFFIFFGLVLLGLLWFILFMLGGKGLQTSLAESGHKYGVAAWLEEMARLTKSFKLAHHSGLHLQKADKRTVDYVDARTQHFRILLQQFRSLLFFKIGITAATLIVGVILLLDQQLNIGQFVAAELIIIMVIGAVEKIIVNLDSVYDVLTAVEKLSNLTDKPVENFGVRPLATETAVSVEARNLSFAYEEGRTVIKNISFNAMPGEKICITGNDGSGKSTLLKVISGIYSDFEGLLMINGLPVKNYDLSSVRYATGILFQNEDIFQGTLMENITMGRTGIDQQYVVKICHEIGLRDFVGSLPFGYDTVLDPTGKRLPRNVIQKILLVRALAHKPSLVILEDPFNAIEEHYCENIRNLIISLPDATVFIATNDERFVKLCTRTIQL
jgi:ATP-binding cassette, subfamily B, bacterial